MANITFKLRGNGENETIYYRFRPNKNFDLTSATPFKINFTNWDNKNQGWNLSQYVKGAKSIEAKKQNSKIEDFNRRLSEFKNKLENFIDDHSDKNAEELKKLIKDFVLKNYFAHRIQPENKKSKNKFPEKFSDFVDFYIQIRSIEDKTKGVKPLAENTIKKYNSLKKVVEGFRRNVLMTDINDLFRIEFVDYLNKNNYSTNTQVKYIKDIKTLCKFADKELPINKQVLHWEIATNIENVSEGVTFTFEQLKKLSECIMPTDYLDNARDWLLISCYTSVRVSELFTFDTENIIEDGKDKYIKVTEKKNANTTGGKKMIYLMPQVLKIMAKRGGEFPRKISDQRYNEFIKKVCEIAGFNEPTEGGIMIEGRKIKSVYPFYKLVTSHSGRKTYVTLYSQYIPTEILQIQTNHHSKEMVEHYNKTDEDLLMLQRARLVAQAHNEVKLEVV